ncbi:MAG TPA: hypothetical protein VN114_06870 [Oxalicibacterium sp.]|uniref:hypothetical protein n=1 Tax=Oxalicibacterium sp. TaxID=2766525 RepID=UPI002B719DCA|nr:hypothetical protein [Oxalicibacterium sp.]HWU98217.1 hypothetical protein [Oxalicibacterium sp.]
MADMDRWSINESLLQSYRSIFISSQSFLLAVGAIVSGKSGVVLYATAAISLVMIWAIWFPVVRSRHLIVDYYKFGMMDFCDEDEYVNKRDVRDNANRQFKIGTNWRKTRKKLDLYTPILVSLVWVVLVIYEAYLAIKQ